MRRALGPLVCLLLLLPTASAEPDLEGGIASAEAYLSGTFTDPSRTPSPGSLDWSWNLARSQSSVEQFGHGGAWTAFLTEWSCFETKSCSDPGRIAKAAHTLSLGAAQDPGAQALRAHVLDHLNAQRQGSSYGSGDRSLPIALAALTYHELGDASTARSLVEDLQRFRTLDGGYTYQVGVTDADPDTTGMIVTAQAQVLGQAPNDFRLRNYLAEAKDDANRQSLVWILRAQALLGIEIDEDVAALLQAQRSDGGWAINEALDGVASNAWTTLEILVLLEEVQREQVGQPPNHGTVSLRTQPKDGWVTIRSNGPLGIGDATFSLAATCPEGPATLVRAWKEGASNRITLPIDGDRCVAGSTIPSSTSVQTTPSSATNDSTSSGSPERSTPAAGLGGILVALALQRRQRGQRHREQDAL